MNIELLESAVFYDLMQAYRHWPLDDQKGVTERLETIKTYIKNYICQIDAGLKPVEKKDE